MFGVDAEKFLQGQTTNDIIKNQYSYNFILNNQGRYLFDFFVYRESNESLYLDIHTDSALALIKRLSMYKLRSDFELKNISEAFASIYSNELYADSIFSLKDPRCDYLGFRSMVEKSKLSGEINYSKNLYINDKYKYAVIDGNPDMIYEKSIPIEYGADDMHAVDYQKGCYIGQEVISRAKYQGVIRKKIYKLEFGTEIALISQGAVITDLDGNKIGIVCSYHEKIAIAQLREEKYLGLVEKVAIVEGQSADILTPLWR
jgi:folate-binding protein YgfZ